MARSYAYEGADPLARKALQEFVADVLRNSINYDWSLQGLGMLRAYVGEHMRLHVWDSRFRVPGVTMLHDHPWDFESYVVAGEVVNRRYHTLPAGTAGGLDFMQGTIICGPGGGECDAPVPTLLVGFPQEVVQAGSSYKQAAVEIHESLPADGTVTIIDRSVPEGGNSEVAHVYWPGGSSWVSAEPRKAERTEVMDICSYALSRWF